MGGLFFVPVGVTVARFNAGFSSIEVSGAAAATLAFAAIGLFDDTLSAIKKRNSGLPAWLKILLEVNLVALIALLVLFMLIVTGNSGGFLTNFQVMFKL